MCHTGGGGDEVAWYGIIQGMAQKVLARDWVQEKFSRMADFEEVGMVLVSLGQEKYCKHGIGWYWGEVGVRDISMGKDGMGEIGTGCDSIEWLDGLC